MQINMNEVREARFAIELQLAKLANKNDDGDLVISNVTTPIIIKNTKINGDVIISNLIVRK